MLAWIRERDLPVTIVATKHDKVSSSRRQRRRRELAEGCGVATGDPIWVSAQRGVNVDRLRSEVQAWLGLPS